MFYKQLVIMGYDENVFFLAYCILALVTESGTYKWKCGAGVKKAESQNLLGHILFYFILF